MIRLFFVTASTLLACLILTYRFSAPDKPADFRYLNPSGIHTLDPARMSWTQDFRVALNIWEGLTSYDPETTEPIGGAALFPPDISADGRVYRFNIRDDARWSNGDSVTADDFIRGWRRAMEPGTAADYSVFFTDHIEGANEYATWRREAVTRLTNLISAQGRGTPDHRRALSEHARELDTRFAQVGVRALDDRTLQVRLIHPCTYFLDLVASPVFLPVHRNIEQMREGFDGGPLTAEGLVVYDPQWTKPVRQSASYGGLLTNGPYRLVDWNLRRRARFEVNPFFRDAAGFRCRTIDMLIYDNIDSALLAYEAGDLDFLPSLDVAYEHEIARLSRTGERKDFYLCPVLATLYLNLNCTSPSINGHQNPFVDARIRKAFALAIDKKSIVENVLARGDRMANSFVPPNSIPHYIPPSGAPYDPALARTILADAGFPDGHGLDSIGLFYTAVDERLCQAVARMWEQNLGVRVELQSKESKTFADDKQNRRFMAAKGNWYADYNDPSTFLDTMETDNGNNDSGYSNPDYDGLLAAARAETDPSKRMRLLQQAEAILVEQDFPIIPILHFSLPIAIKPNVHGLHPNARLWFPFRYVTVDR